MATRDSLGLLESFLIQNGYQQSQETKQAAFAAFS
jgi:hypothetical protein